jgi:hypothetical protein
MSLKRLNHLGEVHPLLLNLRLFVLATPREDEQIDLRLAMSLKRLNPLGEVHPLLRPIPPRWAETFIARQILNAVVHDVKQDKAIWENKRYIHRPALAEGDGPIGKFRVWSRQFYSENADES